MTFCCFVSKKGFQAKMKIEDVKIDLSNDSNISSNNLTQNQSLEVDPSQSTSADHSKSSDENVRNFSCSNCEKNFTNEKYLKRHIVSVHNKKKSWLKQIHPKT